MTSSSQAQISRRHFLGSLCSTAGALVAVSLAQRVPSLVAASDPTAAPTHDPAGPAIRSTKHMSIGVVLPQSTVIPAIGLSLYTGLAMAYEQIGSQVTFHPVEAGFTAGTAIAHVRRLMLQTPIDLVIGFVSRHEIAAINPFLREQNTPMIITDVGANVIRDGQEGDYLFRSSLNHWQANWALGAWSAKQIGPRAFIASAFYESGYDSIYAFDRGFTQAGGAIEQTSITHTPMSTAQELPDLLSAIRKAQPDVVYAAYSGTQAVEFVRAYAAAGLAGRIPLVGPGFLTDEAILQQQGRAATGILTAMSWASDLPNIKHRSFSAAYQKRTGHPVNAFAALGYDTGLMIAESLNGAGSRADHVQLSKALSTITFAGSRGSIQMQPADREALAPLYLREASVSGSSAHNAIQLTLPPAPTAAIALSDAHTGIKTGWLNAYLNI